MPLGLVSPLSDSSVSMFRWAMGPWHECPSSYWPLHCPGSLKASERRGRAGRGSSHREHSPSCENRHCLGASQCGPTNSASACLSPGHQDLPEEEELSDVQLSKQSFSVRHAGPALQNQCGLAQGPEFTFPPATEGRLQLRVTWERFISSGVFWLHRLSPLTSSRGIRFYI